ncbi:MAG: formyltransferase family protein [Candidatus Paceibacterota bacterium]|jgi:methionyl-tRNA formyltransferase
MINYITASNRPLDKKAVSNPTQLYEYLSKHKVDVIFFPFWSWKVPQDIIEKYTCIGFHCGALPLNKGGSPIQNLIRNGAKQTELCAIKMNNEIDGGMVLMREVVELNGNLQQIIQRISKSVYSMIERLINPMKRITDNKIEADSLSHFYDEIRMRDEEGQPLAYIDKGKFRITLRRAVLRNGYIESDARIFLK